MGRLLLLLPLCLLARDAAPVVPSSGAPLDDDLPVFAPSASHKHEIVFVAPVAHLVGSLDPWLAFTSIPFVREPMPPPVVIASLVPFSYGPLPAVGAAPALEETAETYYERMRQDDPLAFLEECVRHYHETVAGYTCILRKAEKIGDRLHDYEETTCWSRENPFSVYMEWTKTSSTKSDFFSSVKQPKKVLYVQGENKDLILAVLQKKVPFRPAVEETTLDSTDSKKSSRFTIDEFGMGKSLERTVASMRSAQGRGQLHLKYLGEMDKEPRLGNVPVYVFLRKPYEPLEEDHLNEFKLYIDKKHWLQVGSILKDDKGGLIGEYFFRDVVVNPVIEPDRFTRAFLEKK
jgi:hypothetical protein